jgi:tellurite resistance protein
MIWLSNSTIARLRDRLRTHGRRPSVVLGSPGDSPASAGEGRMDPEALELLGVAAEYGPFCEAMYLMMSADGAITDDERDVLKGALRKLSGDAVRSSHIDALLQQAQVQVAAEGRDARMQQVIASLREDPERAEVAFVLAAAVAFADNAIADEENETLSAFAEGLGIDETRSNALLDSVEADLRDR